MVGQQKEVVIMFKKKVCPADKTEEHINAYQKGYNRAVHDYRALEPFRKYPQRLINVTNRFIRGKLHDIQDYVDGYEDAKQQLSHN